MWILFHRHGQRIPTRNITSNFAQETALWKSFLPSKDLITKLNSKLKIKTDSRNPIPWDIASEPYGCLTSEGIGHMYNVGCALRKKYPFILRSNFSVRSTNYLRTQLSAQSLLCGLLDFQLPLEAQEICQQP